jgi:hypothetical protein
LYTVGSIISDGVWDGIYLAVDTASELSPHGPAFWKKFRLPLGTHGYGLPANYS